MDQVSITLTVTAKGQVTFRKAVLDHLGVEPGDQLVVCLTPGGGAFVNAVGRGHINAFIGSLAGPADTTLSIEEMTELAASGWANQD